MLWGGGNNNRVHCRLETEIIPCNISRKMYLWFDVDKGTDFQSSIVCSVFRNVSLFNCCIWNLTLSGHKNMEALSDVSSNSRRTRFACDEFLFTSTIIISSFGHLELVLACKGQNAYGQRQNVTPRTWLNLQAAVRIQAL